MKVLIALLLLALTGSVSAQSKKLKGLIVAGGCCHDYENQVEILGKGIARQIHIEWEVVRESKDRGHRVSIYEQEDWYKGYDVVLHNECFGGVDDPAFVRRITQAHSNGVGSVSVHCSTHSYRNVKGTDAWRQLVGATSVRHGPKQPIEVTSRAPEHPIMLGFPAEGWTTIKEELYYVTKVWPDVTVLATGRQGKKTDPVVFIRDYGKGRSFSTTLGHYNETMQHPNYINLVTRGLLWSVDLLNEDGTPHESVAK